MRTFFPGAVRHDAPALRVLVADDHDLVRAGIRALLQQIDGVEVAGEASDGHGLLDALDECDADVAICDIAMPGLDGLAAVTELRARHPALRILMLSMYDSVDFVRRPVAAGANGYLLKRSAPEELAHALRTVMHAGSYFSTEIAQKLLEPVARQPHDDLTERQLQVLVLVAQGLSAKQIGQRLNLSPKTVDAHRARVMERLQLQDIAGLARYAVRMGLVTA
jgi:DNA-binding NarL/FixJ family response regulator